LITNQVDLSAFEAGREFACRGGIVRDENVYESVIERVKAGMAVFGFSCVGVIESPIAGARSGNKEFIGFFVL
jgi:predicted rRNA methylase YqxC with S4 and FtsJ domains